MIRKIWTNKELHEEFLAFTATTGVTMSAVLRDVLHDIAVNPRSVAHEVKDTGPSDYAMSAKVTDDEWFTAREICLSNRVSLSREIRARVRLLMDKSTSAAEVA